MSADRLQEVSMKMDSKVTFSRHHLVPFRPFRCSQSKSASSKSPLLKSFLESIYGRYMGQSSAAAEGIPLTDAQSVRTYFTFVLAALILEDRAAAIRQGESPALDRDPFIGRAEWDVSDLSIDVMDTSAPKTVATVTLTNFRKPEKIVLELLRSDNEWRIANVQRDSGNLRGLYRRKAAYDGEAIP
jgi:Protein of unknown function (DUF3828)